MNVLIRHKQLHQWSPAHAVDHHSNFITSGVNAFSEYLREQLIRNVIHRRDFFPVSSRFAMNPYTYLYFVVVKVKARLSCCRNSARIHSHSHRADISNHFLGHTLHIRESESSLCRSSRDLVHKHRPCYASSSRRPRRVLNSYVISNDNLLNVDPFVFGHVSSHLEIHHVAGVVLDDQQNTLAAIHCLDCLENLVRCRGGKHCSCNSSVQHSATHKSAV